MFNTLQFSFLPYLQSSVFIPSIRWFYSFRYPNLLKWYEAMDKRESYLGIKSDYVSSQFFLFLCQLSIFFYWFESFAFFSNCRSFYSFLLSYFLCLSMYIFFLSFFISFLLCFFVSFFLSLHQTIYTLVSHSAVKDLSFHCFFVA